MGHSRPWRADSTSVGLPLAQGGFRLFPIEQQCHVKYESKPGSQSDTPGQVHLLVLSGRPSYQVFHQLLGTDGKAIIRADLVLCNIKPALLIVSLLY